MIQFKPKKYIAVECRFVALMTALTLALGVTSATAAVSTFFDPSVFSGTVSLIEFDGIGPSSSEITSIDGVGFSLLEVDTLVDTGLGPTFAAAPNSTYAREFPPRDGPYFLNMINFDAPFFTDLRIEFPSPTNRVAAEIRSGQTANDVDNLVLEFYASGKLVGLSTLTIRGQDDFFFYGFESTEPFDEWVIRQRPDARFDLENLRFDSVSKYIAVTSLPDINGAGGSELAALQAHSDDTATVIIKDSNTERFVSKITFKSTGNTPIGLAGVLAPSGAPSVSVLFKKPNGQGVVQIRDAATGAWLRQMQFFDDNWEVKAITSQDSDMDGVSEIAVLAEHDNGKRAAMQIKDAETKVPVKWIELPKN